MLDLFCWQQRRQATDGEREKKIKMGTLRLCGEGETKKKKKKERKHWR